MVTATTRDAGRCRRAEALAAALAAEALAIATRAERRRRRLVDALASHDASRSFLVELTDEVLRIRTPLRASARLADLVAEYGAPRGASLLDRLALAAGARLAPRIPRTVVRLASARLRHELGDLLLPAGRSALGRRLDRHRQEGARLNVNPLGEAVLGEDQARARQRLVLELLGRPDVECVSVKVSALYSQVDVLAYETSLGAVGDRLRPILRAAAARRPAALVTLDMEDYRDLHLTVDAFTALLGEAELSGLEAGIALQAYLPDSADVLGALCQFARDRHDATGGSLRVRLVKGANLAMEQVDAELHGWRQAPYEHKSEVDANYKRLLDIALAGDAGAVHVGVASHNLFDIAWALVLDQELGGGRVEVEMLQGMAPAVARAVARRTGHVLLYAPVVLRDDFESAVAYLVRRFDEQSAPDNFLARSGSLVPASGAWEVEVRRFRQAVADRHLPPGGPRRVPTLAPGTPPRAPARRPGLGGFANAPDTDFSLAAERCALSAAGDALRRSPPGPVAAVVDGRPVLEPLTGVGIDPSSPSRPWYRFVEADLATVERAVAVARRGARTWSGLGADRRSEVLVAVADRIEAERARTVAVMAADAGKVAGEADPEVSEAVDGARYYARAALALAGHHGPRGAFEPHGVVVVTPPWNFPFAIPAGGVLAALAAGNSVVLKPAPEAVLTARLLVDQCHAAGVPGDVLQFLPCADGPVGRRLVTHPGVDGVVLTGAWETARQFLDWQPGLDLHAETSGKNALVVTAAADQEDAVRDLVRSAFSHAGQKCSAASLAIVEAPVHDDPRFLERLGDAVRSLAVGPAADPATRVGPLIRPPEGPLRDALTRLDPGERWLVRPRQVGGNPHLWSPGVKLGVAPGSSFHMTECFGPVLGVMRARSLDEALAWQNAVPYGLTGGISSLDPDEVDRWLEGVRVGNAYVNRHITGAVVGRQPFGGWKRSSVGPGAKAGGPAYVASFGAWRTRGPVDVAAELAAAQRAGRRWIAGEDASGLTAESNVLRLRPLARAVLRLSRPPDPAALAVSLGVARLLGLAVEVSVPEEGPWVPPGPTAETEAGLVARVGEAGAASGTRRPGDVRVRIPAADPSLRLALLDAGVEVDTQPLVALGTYELARWTREQAVSRTVHRHGQILAAPGRRRRRCDAEASPACHGPRP